MEKILFIWVVNNISLVEPFLKFINFNENSLYEVNIFSTNNNIEENPLNLDLSSTIYFEKPSITNLINEFINKYKICNKDLGLICSGPDSMLKEVKNISKKLDIDMVSKSF